MFAPGPRAVGFTIVWPEGVIFRSMMTYHVQFLLLVLAGWVNRQQQDVIDYQQEENRVLRALPPLSVGDVYASLCKRGAYAPFSAQRRSRALF